MLNERHCEQYNPGNRVVSNATPIAKEVSKTVVMPSKETVHYQFMQRIVG
ncbi:hypothetical protein OAG34_01090 [bacterium]|jgi:hypothetical protein|nr:hypothetical protein [bacterium]